MLRNPLTVSFCVLLVLTACGGGGGEDVTVEVIPSGDPPREVVRSETVRLPNCEGAAPLPKVIETSLTTEQSLDLGTTWKVGLSGSVPVYGVDVELGTEIAKTYGVHYGQELKESQSLKPEAAPGTSMVYIVEHYEEWESGIVVVTVKGQTERTKYDFRTAAGLRYADQYDEGCSFLGKIPGEYVLESWLETPINSITLWMEVKSGTLEIDKLGNSSWTLAIQRRGENVSPEPGVICKGRVDDKVQQMKGTPGGADINWTSDIQSFRESVELAFCGWTLSIEQGRVENPFALDLKDLGEGERVLVMQNPFGIFTWKKER